MASSISQRAPAAASSSPSRPPPSHPAAATGHPSSSPLSSASPQWYAAAAAAAPSSSSPPFPAASSSAAAAPGFCYTAYAPLGSPAAFSSAAAAPHISSSPPAAAMQPATSLEAVLVEAARRRDPQKFFYVVQRAAAAFAAAAAEQQQQRGGAGSDSSSRRQEGAAAAGHDGGEDAAARVAGAGGAAGAAAAESQRAAAEAAAVKRGLTDLRVLHWGCYMGDAALIDFLLRTYDLDPTARDPSTLEAPIFFAIKGVNLEAVRHLVQLFGPQVLAVQNRASMTPLLVAAADNTEDNVNELLQLLEYIYLQGVSLEEQDDQGQTALFWAARRGTVSTVQWLLSKGASLNHRDFSGATVLHAAVSRPAGEALNEEIVLFLCEFGAIKLLPDPFSSSSSSSSFSAAASVCSLLPLLHRRTERKQKRQKKLRLLLEAAAAAGGGPSPVFLREAEEEEEEDEDEEERREYPSREGGGRREKKKKKLESVWQRCLLRRHFLLLILLWLWQRQWKLFGQLRVFRSSYALYYWLFSLANIPIFLHVAPAAAAAVFFPSSSSAAAAPAAALIGAAALLLWLAAWLLVQSCWCSIYTHDPGIAPGSRRNIRNQVDTVARDLSAETLAVLPLCPAVGPYHLQMRQLEREQLRLNLETAALLQTREGGGDDSRGGLLREEEEEESGRGSSSSREYLRHAQQQIKKEMHALMEAVGAERRSRLPPLYIDAIIYGTAPPRSVCVTCSIIKGPRVHHCSDCAHCLVRQDHHCVWLDTCVAKRNGRKFVSFLMGVLLLLLYSSWLLCHYVLQRFTHPQEVVWVGLALVAVLTNSMWLLFVVYLLLRSIRCMCTNVTFYEQLKKPEHIRRRFRGKVNRVCWDVRSLSFSQLLRNVVLFWRNSDALDRVYETAADPVPRPAAAAVPSYSYAAAGSSPLAAASHAAFTCGDDREKLLLQQPAAAAGERYSTAGGSCTPLSLLHLQQQMLLPGASSSSSDLHSDPQRLCVAVPAPTAHHHLPAVAAVPAANPTLSCTAAAAVCDGGEASSGSSSFAAAAARGVELLRETKEFSSLPVSASPTAAATLSPHSFLLQRNMRLSAEGEEMQQLQRLLSPKYISSSHFSSSYFPSSASAAAATGCCSPSSAAVQQLDMAFASAHPTAAAGLTHMQQPLGKTEEQHLQQQQQLTGGRAAASRPTTTAARATAAAGTGGDPRVRVEGVAEAAATPETEAETAAPMIVGRWGGATAGAKAAAAGADTRRKKGRDAKWGMGTEDHFFSSTAATTQSFTSSSSSLSSDDKRRRSSSSSFKGPATTTTLATAARIYEPCTQSMPLALSH